MTWETNTMSQRELNELCESVYATQPEAISQTQCAVLYQLIWGLASRCCELQSFVDDNKWISAKEQMPPRGIDIFIWDRRPVHCEWRDWHGGCYVREEDSGPAPDLIWWKYLDKGPSK